MYKSLEIRNSLRKAAVVFVLLSVIVSVFALRYSSNAEFVNADADDSKIILGLNQVYTFPLEEGEKKEFKSYNTDIVKISRSGEITAVSKGDAIIKAGGKRYRISVEDEPTAISFADSYFSLGTGEVSNFSLNVEGSGCNVGYTYECTDGSIAKIDPNGRIEGVAVGGGTVTVTSYNGLKAECTLKVGYAPESVIFEADSVKLYLGRRETIAPKVMYGVSRNLKLTSDNEDVIKPDGRQFTALSEGTATITAETFNGKTATCTVTVYDFPFYIRPDLDPNKPMIALSFDDGPNADTTNAILDVLEQYNGSATFFIVGQRLGYSGNANCAKRMVELGCQLGNHTYYHNHYGDEVTADDIRWGIDAIKEATGYEPTAFRPTGGYITDTIKENANAPIFIWSVDTNDWVKKYRNADKLYNYVIYAADDGDIVLMHDIYSTSATAVEKFVPELVKRGYQIVNIAELAYYKGVKLQNGEIYYSFK